MKNMSGILSALIVTVALGAPLGPSSATAAAATGDLKVAGVCTDANGCEGNDAEVVNPGADDPESPGTPDLPEASDDESSGDEPSVDPTPSVGDPSKGTSSRSAERFCLAGAMVTKVYDQDGKLISSSSENGAPECAPKNGEVFREEGF